MCTTMSFTLTKTLNELERKLLVLLDSKCPEQFDDLTICEQYILPILRKIHLMWVIDLFVGASDGDAEVHSICSVFCGINKEFDGIIGDRLVHDEMLHLRDLVADLDTTVTEQTVRKLHEIDDVIHTIFKEFINNYKDVFADKLIGLLCDEIKCYIDR